jgi:SAM-dependent methyltransferase
MSMLAPLARRLNVQRWRFTFMYLRGISPWDTGVSPPELVETIEGEHALSPGRALDLGCGTGTNALYLARHGWQTTGVDFAAPAIARAREKARRVGTFPGSARFLRADVTALARLDLGEPFSLLFDLGCLHGISAERRPSYASGLVRWSAPGTLYLLYAFGPTRIRNRDVGLTPDQVRALFAPTFAVERLVPGTDRRGVASAWYWLRRT